MNRPAKTRRPQRPVHGSYLFLRRSIPGEYAYRSVRIYRDHLEKATSSCPVYTGYDYYREVP